jgi:hypothetical protein
MVQGRFVGIVLFEFKGWVFKLYSWIAFEAVYDNGSFIILEDLKRYNLFGKLIYDIMLSLKVGIFVQGYGLGWIGLG